MVRWCFLFLLTFGVSLPGYSASSSKVKSLVHSYYQQQGLWAVLQKSSNALPRPLPEPPEGNAPPANPEPPKRLPPRNPNDCQPPGTSDCVDAVCNQISRFECDQRDELLDVANECRNVKGECVRSVCSRVSRFACDEKSEIFDVTSMCRGLVDVSCIDYVCNRISRFDCDELSELYEIARQCR